MMRKQMPKGEARPLGTKRARTSLSESRTSSSKARMRKARKTPTEAEASSTLPEEISALHPLSDVVESSSQHDAAIPPPADTLCVEQHMTLTLVKHSSNGKRAIYSGAAVSLAIPVGAFPDKQAPGTIEVVGNVFAEKVVRTPRAKMTEAEKLAAKEARKNAPKPTIAERARKAQERADKLAKLAASAA